MGGFIMENTDVQAIEKETTPKKKKVVIQK